MHPTVSLPGSHSARLWLPEARATFVFAMIGGLQEEEGAGTPKNEVHMT